MSQNRIDELRKAVVEIDTDKVESICSCIIEEGVDPQLALTEGAIKGLQEVGALFEKDVYALPELMLSVEVMNAARDILEPEILKANKTMEKTGTILMGTVAHDIHDIGKKIVSAMLRAVGFQVIDVGNNISPAKFVEHAKEIKPDIIGMSALLTTTMPYADETAKALREAGIKARLILGGAPVTKEYADKIGVAFAENAGEACRVCSRLMKEEA